MARYILNSAVITSQGVYKYTIIPPEEAREWVLQGNWESRIGYSQTADHIEWLTGVRPPLNREAAVMGLGDEALVVRLKYRVADPSQKGSVTAGPNDWEYGILRRIL